MKEKKLKAVDLAEVLGIRHSVISTWKARNTNPPVEYIGRICDFLDVDVYDLLDIEPREPREQNEIAEIYDRLSAEDRAIVDIIFNKYRNASGKSSESQAM